MSRPEPSPLGRTPPTGPTNDTPSTDSARVIEITRARPPRPARPSVGPQPPDVAHAPALPALRGSATDGTKGGDGRIAAASDRPHRRPGAPPPVPARPRHPDSRLAIVIQREFAITVRALSFDTAQALAQAIERVVTALITPGRNRCRLEATTRSHDLPEVMIECPSADPQTLDTLLRCVESIVGRAMRAKVVLREGTRARIRTWVGAWVEPDQSTRRPRPRRPLGHPSASPAAA